MESPDKEDLRRWADRWQKAGAELERLRAEELLHTDVCQSIELLEDAFQSALINYPASPTSGLVEQQRWFMRLKH